MVQYTELAPGLKISRVLTGLWQIADLEKDGNTLDPHETAKSMLPYVKAGFTTFDMADHYGSAEIITGTFKKEHALGPKTQLLTKWVPKPGKVTRDDVRAAIQLSLDRMQLDRLDLLQFHSWVYTDPAWLDCLFWLQELKEEGLIGALGLTNFDSAHLRIAVTSGIDIASNQICYSLLDQRGGGKMRATCEEFGVKLLAFGTIAGGFLSEKWLRQPEPALDNSMTMSQAKYKRYIDAAGGWGKFQHLLATVKQVANKHDVSIANIASKYMLAQPVVAGVIVGARLGKSAHVQDTLKMFDYELDQADLDLIQSAQANLDMIPGDCGDEYRKPPFLTATGDLSDHLDSIPKPFEPIAKLGGGTKVMSGTIWEEDCGYSRATRKGNRISVSGTTATHGTKMIGGLDPGAQAQFVLDKIQGAIESLGGKLEDVVRTRIFVNDINDWEPIALAHGDRFKDIQPANTLVEAKLVGEGYKVEIEAEAEINE